MKKEVVNVLIDVLGIVQDEEVSDNACVTQTK